MSLSFYLGVGFLVMLVDAKMESLRWFWWIFFFVSLCVWHFRGNAMLGCAASSSKCWALPGFFLYGCFCFSLMSYLDAKGGDRELIFVLSVYNVLKF